MIFIIKAIILGIVEGITEFLPISSTGHLILVNNYIKFTGNFADLFDVVIQIGAIFAVVLLFRKKLFPDFKNKDQSNSVYGLWAKVVVGFIPAMILGFLLEKYIKQHFFNPRTVAVALIVGAVLLLLVDMKRKRPRVETTDEISFKDSFIVGIFQCLALWPGMSRSASTIIGGLFMGLSREAAAEYSFFLAIPTLAGAAALELWKARKMHFTGLEWTTLGVGTIVSFVVALFVVAAFINYLKKKKFTPFAIYRIILGVLVLLFMH